MEHTTARKRNHSRSARDIDNPAPFPAWKRILLHQLRNAVFAAHEGTVGIDRHCFVVDGDWGKVDWGADAGWGCHFDFHASSCAIDHSKHDSCKYHLTRQRSGARDSGGLNIHILPPEYFGCFSNKPFYFFDHLIVRIARVFDEFVGFFRRVVSSARSAMGVKVRADYFRSFLAYAIAMARPMPEELPVMMAILFARRLGGATVEVILLRKRTERRLKTVHREDCCDKKESREYTMCTAQCLVVVLVTA